MHAPSARVWEGPEPREVSDAERERLVSNIKRAFAACGYDLEVLGPFDWDNVARRRPEERERKRRAHKEGVHRLTLRGVAFGTATSKCRSVPCAAVRNHASWRRRPCESNVLTIHVPMKSTSTATVRPNTNRPNCHRWDAAHATPPNSKPMHTANTGIRL